MLRHGTRQEAKSGSLFVLYDNAFMSGFEITELHKQYGTRPKFGSSVMLKLGIGLGNFHVFYSVKKYLLSN